MKYTHQNICDHLINTLGFPKEEFFDFRGHKLELVIQQFFQFSQENLSEYSNEHKISPAYFFIRNDHRVNARARKLNGNFIIAINIGLFENLFSLFHEIEETEWIEFRQYLQVIQNSMDVSISYLMFQIATLNSFYHEKAHLIQFSELPNSECQEAYEEMADKNTYFNLEKNCAEFDADIFAAHQVVFHLIQYWRKSDQSQNNFEKLNSIFICGVASIYIFFLFLMQNHTAIYYSNGDHPHPLVRISYIMDAMVHVAEKNVDFDIDKIYIIRESVELADWLLQKSGRAIFQHYPAMFMAEQSNIADYINNTLVPGAQSMPSLIRNRV